MEWVDCVYFGPKRAWAALRVRGRCQGALAAGNWQAASGLFGGSFRCCYGSTVTATITVRHRGNLLAIALCARPTNTYSYRASIASWLYCCLLITALMLGCHGHVLALSNGPVVSFATGASWQELLPSSFPRRQAPTRSARHQAGATRRGSSFRMLLVSAQLEGATDQRAINAESAP